MRFDSIAAKAPQLIECLERFRSFTMAHPMLVRARDELVDAIDGAAPGSLVFVFGPTGVGKTTVRMKVEELLTRQMAPALRLSRPIPGVFAGGTISPVCWRP